MDRGLCVKPKCHYYGGDTQRALSLNVILPSSLTVVMSNTQLVYFLHILWTGAWNIARLVHGTSGHECGSTKCISGLFDPHWYYAVVY